MMNQKLGGAATAPPVLTAPPKAVLPLAAPPLAGLTARPALPTFSATPAVPTAPPALPAGPVAGPGLRPVTMAAVTRNLQAAAGPQPLPTTPTSKGFPGFVSRNFNQVSQHRPEASSPAMLSNLAKLLAGPAPSAPERRQEPRPQAEARPQPRPEIKLPPAIPQTPPARPLAKKDELPKPLAAPAPTPAKPETALARPLVTLRPTPPPVAPAKTEERPAAEPSPAGPSLPAGDRKPEVPQPCRLPRLLARNTPPTRPNAKPAEVKPVESKPAESRPAQESQRPEDKARLPQQQGTIRPLEPTRARPQNQADQPNEVPTSVVKTSPVLEGPPLAQQQQNIEKLAQARAENSEPKVGEVQRQQINAVQAPITREQLDLAQQAGAGLSAGGGGGSGGGGQQRQQRREQEGRQEFEEVDVTQPVALEEVALSPRRAEDNLRLHSSELREAIFNLRTPDRQLGEEPRPLRPRPRKQQNTPELPRVETEEVGQEEARGELDRVQLEVGECCRACGQALVSEGIFRCPNCAHRAGQQTLGLLRLDPRFIPYRVFLTICPEIVNSQAVFRLSDFRPAPRRGYDLPTA
ncbi:MAG: hypothetical protein U0931_12210 [Vulcanimicrobiota bacterium]